MKCSCCFAVYQSKGAVFGYTATSATYMGLELNLNFKKYVIGSSPLKPKECLTNLQNYRMMDTDETCN